MKRMLSIVLQIHRNILSSQCFIKCVDDSDSFNAIQVKCFSSELELLLLSNDEIVKKVQVISPNDFFIPTSLSSDSDASVISGSTVVCQAKLTTTRQVVVECSFRLQISGAHELFPLETKLNADVKDFFKERFKNSALWNLFCASCGAALPIEPVYIKSVLEYCESELSEGWFCHGNAPQLVPNPSSQVLYLDDISFYLHPTPGINCKVLDKKSCNTDSQKDIYISSLNTNCSNFDSLGIDISNKSAGDYCSLKNIDYSITKDMNSFDVSKSNSVNSDIDFLSLKECNSSTLSCNNQICDDSIHSTTIHKTQYKYGSKVGHSAVQCKSCGDILTTEKFSAPFVRFYYDKLMFKNSSFNEDHLDYAFNIAMLSFWSLIAKGQTSLLPSKLFLQSKVIDEECCLLLWVPSAPVAQFLLQDSFEAFPSEILLETQMVYKVLYFVGTSLSENVRSWRHDFGVDFHHVSDSMMKTLLRILRNSTSHLPQTSVDGGFSCGFLKAPSQQEKIYKL